MPKPIPTPTEKVRAYLLAMADEPDVIAVSYSGAELRVTDLISLLAEVDDDTPLGDVVEDATGAIAVHLPPALDDDQGGEFFDHGTALAAKLLGDDTLVIDAAALDPTRGGDSGYLGQQLRRLAIDIDQNLRLIVRDAVFTLNQLHDGKLPDSMSGFGVADQARRDLPKHVARFKGLVDGVHSTLAQQAQADAEPKATDS